MDVNRQRGDGGRPVGAPAGDEHMSLEGRRKDRKDSLFGPLSVHAVEDEQPAVVLTQPALDSLHLRGLLAEPGFGQAQRADHRGEVGRRVLRRIRHNPQHAIDVFAVMGVGVMGGQLGLAHAAQPVDRHRLRDRDRAARAQAAAEVCQQVFAPGEKRIGRERHLPDRRQGAGESRSTPRPGRCRHTGKVRRGGWLVAGSGNAGKQLLPRGVFVAEADEVNIVACAEKSCHLEVRDADRQD
jgi:hypothetical protein